MAAERAQVDAMKDYIAGCQAFFEKVLTDLLLRAPDDPHAFLKKALDDMSPQEKDQWKSKISGAVEELKEESVEGATSDATAAAPASVASGSLQVVLRLLLNDGADNKEKTMAVLQDLKEQGQKLPGCISFQVFDRENQNEVLVLQTWQNQECLDNYYAQDFFQAATPKFNGLLSDLPDYRTYIA